MKSYIVLLLLSLVSLSLCDVQVGTFSEASQATQEESDLFESIRLPLN
jgi:hypothetical protein